MVNDAVGLTLAEYVACRTKRKHSTKISIVVRLMAKRTKRGKLSFNSRKCHKWHAHHVTYFHVIPFVTIIMINDINEMKYTLHMFYVVCCSFTLTLQTNKSPNLGINRNLYYACHSLIH